MTAILFNSKISLTTLGGVKKNTNRCKQENKHEYNWVSRSKQFTNNRQGYTYFAIPILIIESVLISKLCKPFEITDTSCFIPLCVQM